MSLLETFRVAVRALWRNGMRSFLTTLGIIIGVAAVIAMVAIGEGAKARVESAFRSMGSDLLIITAGTSSRSGAMGGWGSMPTITWDDLKAIQAEVPSVRGAAPALRVGAQVLSDEQNWSTQITGTTPDYFELRGWAMRSGRPLIGPDVDGGAKVCILGQTVVDKLYAPGTDPVGLMVRIKNVPFEVIGILEKKGQSPVGTDYDDAVFVPVSTYLSKVQGGLKKFIGGMIFAGSLPGQTSRAQAQISALLRDRHRIATGADDDFQIRNLTEMASSQQEGTKTMTALLASIAAVSLLVGGIGIMNIMLVSVTERTREIGVRLAVGARRRDILRQFLVESLTLSLTGGLVGVLLGVGIASELASQFGWPLLIKPSVALIAVTFSGGVGVLFGLYPARRASRLDPIEALRFE